jgi:hypothetical protein
LPPTTATSAPAAAVAFPQLRAALAPNEADRWYMNFEDGPTDASTLFTPRTYERLREVKSQYDPGDLFRANHPIPPS